MTNRILPTPSAENTQINEYLAAARKRATTYFISRSDDIWIVQSAVPGSPRNTFTSKDDAVSYAMRLGVFVIRGE